jgi:hypothetical protein
MLLICRLLGSGDVLGGIDATSRRPSCCALDQSRDLAKSSVLPNGRGRRTYPVQFTGFLVPCGIRSDIVSSTISTNGCDGDITVQRCLGRNKDREQFGMRFGMGIGSLDL